MFFKNIMFLVKSILSLSEKVRELPSRLKKVPKVADTCFVDNGLKNANQEGRNCMACIWSLSMNIWVLKEKSTLNTFKKTKKKQNKWKINGFFWSTFSDMVSTLLLEIVLLMPHCPNVTSYPDVFRNSCEIWQQKVFQQLNVRI